MDAFIGATVVSAFSYTDKRLEAVCTNRACTDEIESAQLPLSNARQCLIIRFLPIEESSAAAVNFPAFKYKLRRRSYRMLRLVDSAPARA